MAHPRHGESFGMRVGRWWGQWWQHSRDVQWSFIGCLILRSKFCFGLLLEVKKVWYCLSSLSIQTEVFMETLQRTLICMWMYVKTLKLTGIGHFPYWAHEVPKRLAKGGRQTRLLRLTLGVATVPAPYARLRSHIVYT